MPAARTVRVLSLAAACALVLGTPVAAAATEGTASTVDPSAYGLDVTVGFDGETSSGAWTPVEVSVAPPRPVAGVLAVDTRDWHGGIVRREVTIEVAAGARNVYRFVVPHGDVEVTLTEGGTSARVTRRQSFESGGRFLVGHLGELPLTVPPLVSDVTGRSATWVGVDPAWVSEAQALDSLGTLVAEQPALDALDEAAATALDAAVATGLQLVVVADRVDADADAWTIERAGATVVAARDVGTGRVITTSVPPTAAGRELWSQLVTPGEGNPASDSDVRNDPWQFGRLMSGSEGDVPTVPWLAAFLAAYILAVGPVNGLVLRRLRRQELAWVTVPAVTLLFTAGAATVSFTGDPVVGSGARIVWTVDGVGEETLAVAVRASAAGTPVTTIPGAGWATTPISAGGQTGVSSAVIAPVAGGTEVRMDLASLETGGVLASRPITTTSPLAVEAIASSDQLVVVVTNVGAVPLEGTIVRAGSAHRHVGALAPGEEQRVELDGGQLLSVEPWMDAFMDLEDQGDPVELPLSLEPLLRGTVLDGDPGLVWAVATSTDGDLDVDVDGVRVADAGTLYAVGARPTLPDDGAVGPYAVGRALVSDSGEYRPGPQSVDGTDEAVLRFRLPGAGHVGVLTEDLERAVEFGNQVTLTVWDVVDRRWLPLEEAFPAGRGDPAQLLSPLGELHVRATGELYPFEFSGRSVAGVPDGGGVS